jgi:hypothetical protein
MNTSAISYQLPVPRRRLLVIADPDGDDFFTRSQMPAAGRELLAES